VPFVTSTAGSNGIKTGAGIAAMTYAELIALLNVPAEHQPAK
jgi:hypothetical protein